MDTEALAHIAHGIGTTLHIEAEILVRLAWNSTPFEWVAAESQLASAVIASKGVDALSILSTDVMSALINIPASLVSQTLIASLTLALRLTSDHGAFCILSTADCRTGDRATSCLLATRVGISSISSVTDTAVGCTILTVAVVATTGRADRRNSWRHTH